VPEVIFEINRDLSVPMRDQAVPGHNRWHPDIPPAATIRPGSTYRIECKDWTDDQVRNTDDADDIRDMNIDPCHMLSGPFAIEGAEPGEILSDRDEASEAPAAAADEEGSADQGETPDQA
jgi:formamidase